MERDEARTPPVKSVSTAFRIIETIRELNGARPGELSDALDLPTSTVSDYLVTLHQGHYLIKEQNEYRIGLRFLELGDQARSNQRIYHVSQGKVDQLADNTGELAHLSVEQDGLGVIIYERSGPQGVSLDTYVGRRVQLHCTALGKAMLAYFSDRYVEEILDRYGLEAKTEQTITDSVELYEELDRVREQGFAVSRGERIDGLATLAVPLRGQGDRDVLGALSLCVPMSQTEDGFSSDVIAMVRNSADRIELDVAFD